MTIFLVSSFTKAGISESFRHLFWGPHMAETTIEGSQNTDSRTSTAESMQVSCATMNTHEPLRNASYARGTSPRT
jgi:hypothetical protein